MKLSILIFVLTTIIYGCQCAPAPGWEENVKQDMENLRNKLREDREKRNEELEAARQQREENRRQLHEQLEAGRQQREENRRQLHERLERERQQREQSEAEIPQNFNGININVVNGQSTIITSNIVNGNRVDKIIVENVINNVKYRTETEYTPATSKTKIKKYECTLPPNSQCILTSTEVKDGPPENFN